MNGHFLERILHFLAGVGWVMGSIWIGLCLFTVGLLILMYTRWGQSHPLEKCVGLSVFAHVLLMVYITTISLAEPMPSHEPAFQIALVEGDAGEIASPSPSLSNGESAEKTERPWEVFSKHAVEPPKMAELDRQKTDSPPAERVVHAESDPGPTNVILKNTALSKTVEPEPSMPSFDEPLMAGTITESVAPPLEAPLAQKRDPLDPAPTASLPQAVKVSPLSATESQPERKSSIIGEMPHELLQPVASRPHIDTSAMPDPGEALANVASSRKLSELRTPVGESELPEMYKLRMMPNRSDVAGLHGGSPETEKAVQSALKWLAENQAADGRWKAGDHGAGRDDNVQGHARQNAGSQADTGVTGLALLAFLASGNTHEDGEYKDNIRHGLEFLIRTQARDGNLGGNASTYEFMYCHAMATCALSEAYGMTRDSHLREPVTKAIRYSIAAQDAKGGGWRYHAGDAGDTSQLGWQLMALKSAELAGIATPDATRRGISRFLQSVSSGKHGGLASYRAGEQVSHSMTAEALVCWQFLGISRDHPACNEAGDYLLTQLPGQGDKPNDYYWYYGTMAMYQLQGDYWQKWNAALQKTLLERQIKEGPLAGAWDTDTVWGGYGGRIYTTSIAALSLEVYYRFLPLYGE